MSPGDLPDWAFVGGKAVLWLLLSITAHTANLYEAFAVDTGDLSPVKVKLAIVDVVFVLRVHFKRVCSLLGDGFLLRCCATRHGCLAKTSSRLLLLLECHLLFRVKKECLF